ncbi:hypothetical protein R4518_14890 [Listeria monocytogenes]|nr:hypothetical protein R4518_14890 [Listeria monocytogenes]WOS29516.1 hypothetical protein R5O29_08795 [Listeria monocytogenes]
MKIKGLNNAIADVLKTYTKDVEQELETIQKKSQLMLRKNYNKEAL